MFHPRQYIDRVTHFTAINAFTSIVRTQNIFVEYFIQLHVFMYCIKEVFKKAFSISGIVCVVPVVIIASISITVVPWLVPGKPV